MAWNPFSSDHTQNSCCLSTSLHASEVTQVYLRASLKLSFNNCWQQTLTALLKLRQQYRPWNKFQCIVVPGAKNHNYISISASSMKATFILQISRGWVDSWDCLCKPNLYAFKWWQKYDTTYLKLVANLLFHTCLIFFKLFEAVRLSLAPKGLFKASTWTAHRPEVSRVQSEQKELISA